jgi:tRNA dimethylallyltransferase
LRSRIEARVDDMVRRGALEDVLSAERRGASRTAKAAIGYTEMLTGNAEAMERAQWRFARRQLTWMRRMEDVIQIDRSGRDDAAVAAEIVSILD